MREYCPKCDKDISQAVYEDWLEGRRGFMEYDDFECPHCNAKLSVTPDVTFYIEEIE